jgi:hypothetical protein
MFAGCGVFGSGPRSGSLAASRRFYWGFGSGIY